MVIMNTGTEKSSQLFSFLAPTKLLGGSNALANLCFELKEKNVSRPLVIMDEYAQRLGYFREVKRAMQEDDIRIIGFCSGVTGVPADCDAAVKKFKQLDCDCILGLGGPEVVNVAKAVKLMIGQNANAFDMFRYAPVVKRIRYGGADVPLFLLPCGIPSGIEATTRVRIADPETNLFYNFDSRRCCAAAVILDKRLTDIMPAKALGAAGLNALAMGILGFVDNAQNSIAQSYATSAIHAVMNTLVPAMRHNADAEYRMDIYSAIIEAGVAYYNARGSIFRDIVTEVTMRTGADLMLVTEILFPHFYRTRMNEERIFKGVLMPIAGEDVYASTNFNARDKVALEHIVTFWDKVTELAELPTKLSQIGAVQSDFAAIAEAVIARYRGDDADVSNFTYITELLEKAF